MFIGSVEGQSTEERGKVRCTESLESGAVPQL
jgi:hypothetical protein